MDVTVRTRNVDLLSKLGNGLKRQFELQKLCDVTLTTANQESPQSTSSIECHKVVLSSSSKYFEQYITDNGDEVNIIDVSPIGIDVMKEVLAFLYNGECLICESNVLGLLDTARAWEVPELAAECCRYIITTMTVDNVCYFYEALSKFDHQETSAKLCYFIRKHFKELHQNKQISCLSVASFNKILAFDDINVDNEDVIFQSAEMIVEKSSDAVGQADLAKCWELIRFEFMSMTYLVDTVMFHELLSDGPQRNYVKHAMAYNHKDSVNMNKRTRRTWTASKPIRAKVTQDTTHQIQVDNRKLIYIDEQKMVCQFNKVTNSWVKIMLAPSWIDPYNNSGIALCPAGLIVAAGDYNETKVSVLDLSSRREIRYPNISRVCAGDRKTNETKLSVSDLSSKRKIICSTSNISRVCAILHWNDTVYLVVVTPQHDRIDWQYSNFVYTISQSGSCWKQHQLNINVENPRIAPIDKESCYLIDSRSAFKINLTTYKCTALPDLPEQCNTSSAGIIVYKNQLTVVNCDQMMTLENNRWIIKRYAKLYFYHQTMLHVYEGKIHACVKNRLDKDYKVRFIKYDFDNNIWKNTIIPEFTTSTVMM